MDSTLDFVTRARRAFQEFRHPTDAPGGLNAVEPREHSNAGIADDEEARPHPSLYPKITAMENQARLAEFRLLVGIVQDKSFTGHFGFQHNRRSQPSLTHRAAPNVGIYSTVCDNEIKAKRNFKGASRFINIALGLQIVVAAALTALGAANKNGGAVTAFGAINTVIAGLMSYLKGSGLPNRLKYFQHEWHKLRQYIEERERDFYLGIPGLDVHDEVEKVRRMFEDIRTDIETNTPERFVSVTQIRTAAAAAQTQHAIQRPQPSFSTDSYRKTFNEKEAEVQGAVHKAQDTAHGVFSNLSHLKDVMSDKINEAKQMEKAFEERGRYMADEKKRDLEKGIQSTVSEVGDVARGIEHDARAAAAQQVTHASQQLDDAVTHTSDAARGMGNDARAAAAQQVAQRSQQIDNGLAHSSEATRSGLAEQRDNLNAVLWAEKEKGSEGPPPKPT